jgi:hypothetical protein
MDPPIIGTIVVTQQTPSHVVAQVDGQRRVFRDLTDLFRAAVHLAGERPPATASPPEHTPARRKRGT